VKIAGQRLCFCASCRRAPPSSTPGTQILEVGDPTDFEIEAEILSRDAVAIKPGRTSQHRTVGAVTSRCRAGCASWNRRPFTKISALGVEEQRVIVLSDLVNPPPEARRLGDR